MNGKSVRWTSSSRLFNTHPLRVFIMKFILSFIVCISMTICGGAISMTNGQLVSYRFCLLGALLPSGPSRSLLLALMLSCSFPWLLGPASLCRSCSSRSWFCLVRCSTAVAKVCTYLSRVVVRGSSLLLLLLFAIKRVSTIQLFVQEVVVWLLLCSFPQTVPTDDAENRQ